MLSSRHNGKSIKILLFIKIYLLGRLRKKVKENVVKKFPPLCGPLCVTNSFDSIFSVIAHDFIVVDSRRRN